MSKSFDSSMYPISHNSLICALGEMLRKYFQTAFSSGFSCESHNGSFWLTIFPKAIHLRAVSHINDSIIIIIRKCQVVQILIHSLSKFRVLYIFLRVRSEILREMVPPCLTRLPIGNSSDVILHLMQDVFGQFQH